MNAAILARAIIIAVQRQIHYNNTPNQDNNAMNSSKQFTFTENGLQVLAPAKINLSLLIAGRRKDGFHEIETIMARINLYDRLIIEPAAEKGIKLTCSGPQWSPSGRENLVYRAAEMLLNQYRPDCGIKIRLIKNIPAGTGLGSASSDAASTLMGLCRLLNADIQPEILHQFAEQLGSDVPFFLAGPLALCTGRGEKIKKIDKKFHFTAILIIPEINSSTKEVYKNYRHFPSEYNRFKSAINNCIQKNRIDLIAEMCTNMLESSCFSIYKELENVKKKLESHDIGPVCLSGSGSSMYCLLNKNSTEKAEEYKQLIKEETGCTSIIVNNNRW